MNKEKYADEIKAAQITGDKQLIDVKIRKENKQDDEINYNLDLFFIDADGEISTINRDVAFRKKKNNNLRDRINTELNKKILATGKMGTDTVKINLLISQEEKEDFLKIDLNNDLDVNGNFNWEIKGNNLYITYSEE